MEIVAELPLDMQHEVIEKLEWLQNGRWKEHYALVMRDIPRFYYKQMCLLFEKILLIRYFSVENMTIYDSYVIHDKDQFSSYAAWMRLLFESHHYCQIHQEDFMEIVAHCIDMYEQRDYGLTESDMLEDDGTLE